MRTYFTTSHMKLLFYFLLAFLVASVAINIYAFSNRGFFRSPLSIMINSLTLLIAVTYIIAITVKKKKLKNKLHEEYKKFFNKN